MSVNALLDAVEPVCRAAPGILIDDARPRYRHDEVAPSQKLRPPHHRPYRVILWGLGDVGNAVMQAARADPRFEVIAIASRGELLTAEADCAVVTTDPMTPSSDVDAVVLALLESGKNVVSTAADNLPASRLREACQRGGASIHRIGFHATLMISRMVMTMVQGLSAVRHIRIIEALDLSSTPERRREAAALGFGRDAAGFDGDSFPASAGNLAHVIATVARDLYAAAATDVRIERSCRRIPGDRAFEIEGGPVIEAGTVAAICTIHRGYFDDRHFFTSEQWRYLGAENAHHGDDLPYGGFRGPASYAVQIRADPADLESQWDLEPAGTEDPVSSGCARMILDAIGPVCEAEPGVLIEDPSPRYQHDDRVER
jgi:4-hydroxy-tetrahydrodipicolinate reductase